MRLGRHRTIGAATLAVALLGALAPACGKKQPAVQVGPPDVAAVDHPGRQVLVGRETLALHLFDLPRRADEVQSHAVHRQADQRGVGVADVAEVGLHQQLRAALGFGQRGVGAPQRRQLGLGAFLHQAGLVELDPGGAPVGQAGDHLLVDGQ